MLLPNHHERKPKKRKREKNEKEEEKERKKERRTFIKKSSFSPLEFFKIQLLPQVANFLMLTQT
jgi:hypothetical protein